MRIAPVIVALSAGGLFIAQLAAQTPQRLTLADARRIALANNPRISAAALTAAAAHQRPAQYRASYAPSLTASFTGVGADAGSRLAAGGLNNPVVYNRLGSGVTIGQMITDFGRTGNLLAGAKLHAEAQDQATVANRADVLLETSRAYFNVLRTMAVAKVADQTVAARQLVVDQVTALAKSQLKSTLDVSFAEVNLASAQLLQSQARNDLSAAQAELAAAMGVPGESGFNVAEEPMPDPLPDHVAPLLQAALQERPELRDLRLEQSSAQRLVKAEHALYYPTIGVGGTAGFVPSGDQAIPGRYGAIGLNVSIPIFNGGLFKARESEAELNAQAASQKVRDIENGIMRDVRVAFLNATNALDRVSLTERLLKQAQLAQDLAQTRYNLGLGSIVELSQAELNLTTAQIANTSARYDYQAQRVLLDYQVGVLR